MRFFSKAKYYEDIDSCPVGVFQKVINTGELKHLCIEGKPDHEKIYEHWVNIFDEYIAVFGMPSNYLSYLKKMVIAINLFSQAYNENRKDLITMAHVREREALIDLGDNEKGDNFHVIVANVSKFMGYQVDPMKTSVRQFYGYLQLLSNG